MSQKQGQEQKDRIEVMMPLESITGKYANYLRVGHTPSEFILDFCMFGVESNAHSVSRIIVNPALIKSFVKALLHNIDSYETNFNIDLPENIDNFIEKGVIKKG